MRIYTGPNIPLITPKSSSSYLNFLCRILFDNQQLVELVF